MEIKVWLEYISCRNRYIYQLWRGPVVNMSKCHEIASFEDMPVLGTQISGIHENTLDLCQLAPGKITNWVKLEICMESAQS